jgi:sugar phosphate isomerase/epimerase
VPIRGICLNGDVGYLGGSLARLEEELATCQACGFDGIELSIDGLDVMIGGRLVPRLVDRVRAVTERFDLIYTVHDPGRLNLAFPGARRNGAPDLAMEKTVLAGCLEFCAAIGAGVLVYHSGLMGLHEAAVGMGPLPGEAALEAARAQEVAALRELMPLAAERGVVVGMENRDPHLWELAVLRQAGRSPDDLLTYHPGLSIPEVVRQVAAVDHPNLGMTLDLGHLYLAANHCGFDFLTAVGQAAPYVRHIHMHDNLGRLDSGYGGIAATMPFGEADLHMPPGWGTIPLAAALAQMPGFNGLCILEIQPRWADHRAEALAAARQLFATAPDSLQM